MEMVRATVEKIAREMGLDEAEIAKRMRFLEFGEHDIAALLRIHARLRKDKDGFTSAFYRHLLGFPELQELLPDKGTRDRLRSAQSTYFDQLTAGDYGRNYIHDRLAVGVVHQKIGLAPKWYIGAYRKYLSELMKRVWALMRDKPDAFLETYDAILKVVCFDMGLALDTYFETDRQIVNDAHRKLQESEEHFRQIFAQAGLGIAYITSDGRLIRVNRKMSDILGFSEEELLQRRFDDLAWGGAETGAALAKRLFAGDITEYSQEQRYVHKDGHPVWANVTVSALHDATGRTRYVALVEDITRRKHAEEELVRMANFDALTSLPNRLLLQDRLGQAILRAQRAMLRVAVMFIDLDRFKNINDSLGHDAGDQVIIEVGSRLSATLRTCDTVARLGGDEFVVVLPDMVHRQDVALVADKILAALCRPIQLGGQEMFPTGSIGISLYPDDGQDAKALLKNADAAMYRAKNSGRNNFQFYAGDMSAHALDKLKLEGALRRALERDEFVLHYQPQFDVRAGKLVGLEALIRWQPQGQGLISPSAFIPIAEETGLILPIGDWVLHAACAQQDAWRRAGLPAVRININLAARQFQHRDLVQQIRQVLGDKGCAPENLGLEITESAVMENPEQAARILSRLSEMGIRLAIDDFGTGYSSLGYLKQFPIDSLKIDHSFVRDIATDGGDARIVQSVIALAHSLKLDVIAEGVENDSQMRFLSEQGCDLMQGYLFSHPVPPEQIEPLLGEGASFLPLRKPGPAPSAGETVTDPFPSKGRVRPPRQP